MDIHLLMAERSRVADEFRAKLSFVAALRGQLANARTDEARQSLYAAVDRETGECRNMGQHLFQLDAKITAMQWQERADASKDSGSSNCR